MKRSLHSWILTCNWHPKFTNPHKNKFLLNYKFKIIKYLLPMSAENFVDIKYNMGMSKRK